MNGGERSEIAILTAKVETLTLAVGNLSTKFDVVVKQGDDHEQRVRSIEKELPGKADAEEVRSLQRWKSALPVGTVFSLVALAITVVVMVSRT